ncbi:unnamed protein product [Lampetra planeri]
MVTGQGPVRLGLLAEARSLIHTEPLHCGFALAGSDELGRGRFGVVRKCVEVSTGREFAAKFVRKRRKGQDLRAEIIHEVAILELAHGNPHVIGLHRVYETAGEIILVLEYAAGGEIFNQCVAEREEAFTERDVVRLMTQILDGVAFLHRKSVVHLDLKPQNILLTSTDPLGDIRIVDFGLSRRVSSADELREIMGTPEYVAPEILSYEPISTAADMWSIGVLAYVMLTGESPFLGEDKQETFLNVAQVNVSYDDDSFSNVSYLAVTFIQTLLLKEPEMRATAEESLRHPWLLPSDIPLTLLGLSLHDPVPRPAKPGAQRDATGQAGTTGGEVAAAANGEVGAAPEAAGEAGPDEDASPSFPGEQKPMSRCCPLVQSCPLAHDIQREIVL